MAGKYLTEYFTEIPEIKETIRDYTGTKSGQYLYFRAMNTIFPLLFWRFKDHDTLQLNDWTKEKIKEFYRLPTNEANEIRKSWEKEELGIKIWRIWKDLNPNKRSEILMKINDLVIKKELDISDKDQNQAFNRLVWAFQGFLGKINKLYQANPRMIKKKTNNGFNLSEKATFEDIVKVYDHIENPKIKLIYKIQVFTGLNQVDILKLKPNSFHEYLDDEKKLKYNYISEQRTKTQNKDTQYLIVFPVSFVNEIKEFFNKETIKHIKKTPQTKKIIEKYRANKLYDIVREYDTFIEFTTKRDWKKNKSELIFEKTSAVSYRDNIRNIIKKFDLSTEVDSKSIRRIITTRLKSIFSLNDEDLFHIWTQHKTGILTRNYTVDLLNRLLPYLDSNQIQSKVLIGSSFEMIKEISKLKTGIEEIDKMKKNQNQFKMEYLLKKDKRRENEKEIEKLKEENAKMKEIFNESLKIFENRFKELQEAIQKKKG